MERRNVKITILKNQETGNIFKQYAAEDGSPVCPLLKEGQVFISKGMAMPEGFCNWAWADIQRDIVHLSLGGDFPWIKKKGTQISCCTDGLKPVIMKLERF